MTTVIFSFDTEDYTNPGADDAIVRLAETLREEGIRASFNIVAALAEALVERRRRDVLDALAYHEINYHTYRHTWHPVPAEYSDTPDWDGPYQRLLAEEGPGIEVVKQVFGRERLYAAVPPGNCVTAQSLYAYPQMGLPLCVSSFPLYETVGQTIHYGGGLYVENNSFWDSLLLNEGLAGAVRQIATWRTWERLVICMHPNLIYYPVFWDTLNLAGANHVAWGQWRLPERRSAGVINQFFADLRQAIRALRADGNFRFTTFQEVVESAPARPPLTREDLLSLLDSASRKFFFATCRAGSYSLAEMFGACVYFLNGGAGQWMPEIIAGPTEEAQGVSALTRLSAADLRAAAARMGGLKVIPAQVQVGHSRIGPRDFLEAARQILQGAEQAEVAPGPQTPDYAGFYHLDEANLAGTWMYAPDFQDEWVSRRLQWQAWTIHL